MDRLSAEKPWACLARAVLIAVIIASAVVFCGCSPEEAGSESDQASYAPAAPAGQESGGSTAAGESQAEDGLQAYDSRFDPLYRVNYAALTEREQQAYREVVLALDQGELEVGISIDIDGESAGRVAQAIMLDQPEFFWITGAWTASTMFDRVQTITFEANSQAEDLPAARKAFQRATAKITGKLDGLSDVEKERAVHDALLKKAEYSSDATDKGQSAYSALVEGRSVCAGYARAFQHLMIEVGMPCYYVSGEAEGSSSKQTGAWAPHAWNLVVLDEGTYNVDPTWDDHALLGKKGSSYQYFNKTDQQIAADHQRGEEAANVPPSSSGKFSFKSAFGKDPVQAALVKSGKKVFMVAKSASELEKKLKSAVLASDESKQKYLVVLRGKKIYAKLADVISAVQQAVVDQRQQSIKTKWTSVKCGSGAYAVNIKFTIG